MDLPQSLPYGSRLRKSSGNYLYVIINNDCYKKVIVYAIFLWCRIKRNGIYRVPVRDSMGFRTEIAREHCVGSARGPRVRRR